VTAVLLAAMAAVLFGAMTVLVRIALGTGVAPEAGSFLTIFPAFVGAGYAGVVLGGYFFLGESLSASKAVGVVVILVGIGLVAR